jgi:hypothetical protein
VKKIGLLTKKNKNFFEKIFRLSKISRKYPKNKNPFQAVRTETGEESRFGVENAGRRTLSVLREMKNFC